LTNIATGMFSHSAFCQPIGDWDVPKSWPLASGGNCVRTSETRTTTVTAATSTSGQAPATVAKVSTTIIIAALDYDKLEADQALKDKLVDEVKTSVVASCGEGYTKEHVAVTLSKGSVIVNIEITPMTGQTPATLRQTLATNKNGLNSDVTTKVKAIAYIDTALEANKKLADVATVVADPVVGFAATTSQPFLRPPTSGSLGADLSRLTFIVLLALLCH